MPPLPDVPQVLKFTAQWTIDGDPMAITNHYFRYTGSAPSAGNCVSFADDFVAAAQSRFNGLCLTTIGMDSCAVTDLTSPTSGQGSGGTPWVGTVTDARLSPGTAVLVNHQLARRYRGGKPRTYLPLGGGTNVTTAGLWTNTFAAAVATAWGDFVADIRALSVGGCSIDNIVNVSYYSGFTVVTNPSTGRVRNKPTVRAVPVVSVITSHTVPTTIASQRRRNRNA